MTLPWRRPGAPRSEVRFSPPPVVVRTAAWERPRSDSGLTTTGPRRDVGFTGTFESVDDTGQPPRRRLRLAELIGLDALAAAGYAVLFLLGPVTSQSGSPAWLKIILVLGILTPVALRRLAPRVALAIVLPASVVALALGMLADPFLAAGYAMYHVAVTAPRLRWEPTIAISAASGAVVLIGVFAGSGPDPRPEGFETGFEWAPPDESAPPWAFGPALLGSALLGGAWTVGCSIKERRQHDEWSRERHAERAVAEERLRIARELHDIVSHTLSVIGVKAGIANHVAHARPEEARRALQTIEEVSRDALVEMRIMLGVLRSQEPPREEDPLTALTPVPGLAKLSGLVDRARSAGVAVTLEVTGVRRLPRALEVSVYRIVREALTNVVRHAAPTRCRVLVEGTPTAVRIEVTDHGPGSRRPPPRAGAGQAPEERALDRDSPQCWRPRGPGGTAGHGLLGMRERVAAHGGTLSVGPVEHGGFRVNATLPLPVGEPVPTAEPTSAEPTAVDPGASQ